MVTNTKVKSAGKFMSPNSVKKWLFEMETMGIAKTDYECAKLLGVTDGTILNLKTQGASKAIALACTAIKHNMKPYE